MRIVSGKYKGRKIDGYNLDGTRPTMDRIKESMTAMIQNKIKGSVCLDLFSGSGSIGLELLSNGAKKCYFVDHSKEAIAVLNNNLKNLKVNEEYNVLNKDYKDALLDFKNNHLKFDLIILDPPYHEHLINHILEMIVEYQLLQSGGIVMCEYESEIVDNQVLTLMKERKYGSKYIKIYKN
ncbi:MAG: 16S rRNA (guanine(966)-N(2))-methyltransferase RsmD [Bacilli bacterium]|nr:16S rRNA (guanine(966)-N(2))-methyltransferase RsmD [Bacilli bacterium]MDD4809319.1 16S rRNA (guanine(966)-N(2))-methyltransferase RsmD [Bacilli bacterium]